MDVSVIVPVYNASATLTACLEGLHAQDEVTEEVELIFVDNCSTDDCARILEADGRVKIIHEKKPGAYSARNAGAAAATGRILAFTDPDCIPDRLWLRSLIDALAEPDLHLALGVRRPHPDKGLNRMLGDYDTTRDEWTLSSGESVKYYGYTNNMGVSEEMWKRYGPFDERLRGSDTIFVRRVSDGEGCEAIKFVPSMVVSHLEMDSPRTYLLKMFTYGRSLQSYQRKIRVRPLSMANRLAVFRRTLKLKSYGYPRSLILAMLLMSGIVAWRMGRLCGRFISFEQ